jgi:putative tryptophan/tyrosine transport system substrate-binding protein
MTKTVHILIFLFLISLASAMSPGKVGAVEVVIVGDTQLKLVAEVVSGIRKTMRVSIAVYSYDEAKGTLSRIVEKEQARIVIALGREALNETQDLPVDIPVIYGLILTPPGINRPNTTGIYMAAPVREYAALVKEYLPSINRVAVIGSRDQLDILDSVNWESYSVKNPAELVETVKQLNNTNAILILPNVSLLIPSAMEETYLQSFRKGIPLLGVSEGQVRDGALLALVVDLVSLGRSIGEYASAVIYGTKIEQLPPAPAKHFDLYLNIETAKKMGILIPDKMAAMAKGVYP